VSAARQVQAAYRALDILVLNAGVMAPPTPTLVNGVEYAFAVNHLGHFVLWHHLQPLLRAAPQGRVVVVSSAMIGLAPPSGIALDRLGDVDAYDAVARYAQSKLANWLFTIELARRLRDSPITANAVHPGVVNTNFDRWDPAWRRLLTRVRAIARPQVKSVAAGAATQVYVATAPSLARVTGRFFVDCNPIVVEDPPGRDPHLAAKLWARSEELTSAHLT
jgi:NAD(P)-dependent dehydrogenase (short-subunit alcohol dehydrogenase family)